MRLEDCYPIPPKEFGVHKDYYPDRDKLPMLYYTWRIYSCSCGKLTGWRVYYDGYESPVCSTECLEAFAKQVGEKSG